MYLKKLESIATTILATHDQDCPISNLTDDQLRALLAYHYYKDDSPEYFVLEVWKTDPHWADRELLLNVLNEIFGYK